MTRHFSFFLLAVAVMFTVSCRKAKQPTANKQLTVSILPQKFLVEYISGNRFDVQVMLPPGSNHETYEPAPRDMEKISSSKLYFILGYLDFELTWLDRLKAANHEMQIINTSEGIEMLSGHLHENEDVSHKNGTDPHIWLSTSCMKIQAANICKALTGIDSANKAVFYANLQKFNILADSVDQEIRKRFSGMAQKTVLIFHPALGYFARDYHLTQISIEREGKEPSPANMGGLIKMAKEKGIASVFISKEFDTRHAEAIAREIGGKVVVFDPMSENWPQNMIHLAELIAEN